LITHPYIKLNHIPSAATSSVEAYLLVENLRLQLAHAQVAAYQAKESAKYFESEAQFWREQFDALSAHSQRQAKLHARPSELNPSVEEVASKKRRTM
jgi:hypothetical protein